MKKQFTQAAAIAAALFLMTSGAAMAQQSPVTPQDRPSTSTPTGRHSGTQARSSSAKAGGADGSFIKKAAEGGLAEVELGRLAAQKASNEQVKQFGQRMVDDHGKANDQLKPIAQQNNVTIPTQLAGKEKAAYDRLSKLSGEQFDRAYMRMMVRDHRKDVNEFRKESASAKDDQVKQFASSTLPTLEDHLKMAESTASAVGAATRATSGTKTNRRAKGTSGTSGRTGTTDTTPRGGTSGAGAGTTSGGAATGGSGR